MISGSSIGIFSAYAVSANKLDDYELIFKSINEKNPIKLFHKVFAKKLIRNLCDYFVDKKDFLDIPLCFPVSFLPFFSVEYYWIFGEINYMWKKYVLAGVNFPFLKIFPSKVGKRLAIDGEASDNIPIFPLVQEKSRPYTNGDLDLIIVLHFDSRFDYRKEFDLEVPVLEIDLTICNDFKHDNLNFSSEFVTEMIEKGYEYGMKICERVFNAENIQEEINDIFIEERPKRLKNISADRLISILNNIAKIVRKDDCIKYIL